MRSLLVLRWSDITSARHLRRYCQLEENWRDIKRDYPIKFDWRNSTQPLLHSIFLTINHRYKINEISSISSV